MKQLAPNLHLSYTFLSIIALDNSLNSYSIAQANYSHYSNFFQKKHFFHLISSTVQSEKFGGFGQKSEDCGQKSEDCGQHNGRRGLACQALCDEKGAS